ncbi:MAG: hypothetical protein V1932_00685 [Chloroflexota bacterium]
MPKTAHKLVLVYGITKEDGSGYNRYEGIVTFRKGGFRGIYLRVSLLLKSLPLPLWGRG